MIRATHLTPPITYPPYLPAGELRLTDPDGVVVSVAQWGDREHEAWVQKLTQRGFQLD